MGTLFFILLNLTRVIDLPYDLLFLCFLMSLDSIALAIFYLGMKSKRNDEDERE